MCERNAGQRVTAWTSWREAQRVVQGGYRTPLFSGWGVWACYSRGG